VSYLYVVRLFSALLQLWPTQLQ